MSPHPWEHTATDGRGPRQVYLNGRPINRVLYANTRKGKVRIHDNPPKLHKHGKRLIERTLHGVVTVEPIALDE